MSLVTGALTVIPGLIGEGETFWVFAVIPALGLLFTVRFVPEFLPETKARDFAEVDRDLHDRFGDRRLAD